MGKIYLVTGAGGGIGQAICEVLCRQGNIVMATDVREDALQQLREVIGVQYTNSVLEVAQLDVTNAEAFQQLVDDVCQRHGQLDVIINNAGIMASGHFADMDDASWQAMLSINVMGVVNGSRAAWRVMKKQGFGKIVNVSSTAGITPVLHSTSYAASKHAVVGFTRSLREEARELGINVVLVIPGLIDTGIFDRADDKGGMNSRAMADKVPLKKLSPNTAARVIIEGIEKGQTEIVFPLINKLLVVFYRLFPNTVARLIASRQVHQ